MKDDIDISNYEDYFHDGYLVQIENKKNSVFFVLIGCQMDPEEFKEKLPLSHDNTLRGKLFINGIKCVLINGKKFNDRLEMMHDYAEIYDLEISDNKVRLFVSWKDNGENAQKDYPPTEYNIFAKQVEWESIPDLVDPSN